MKVTIRRDSLERLWPVLAPAAGTFGKTKAVRLAAHAGDSGSGNVVLTAAGDEIGIRATVEAEVLRSGEVLLPPGRFAQVLRETSGDVIGIELQEDGIAISAPGAVFHFPVLPIENARLVPPPTEGPSCQIDSEALAEAIDLACRTADQQVGNPRWTMHAVYLQPCEQGLRVVATDGRRMLVMVVAAAVHPECSGSHLVALQVGDVIGRCRMGGQVRMSFAGPTCTLDYGDFSMRCQLLQGSFPPWREIVPKQKPVVVASLVASDFLLILRQAAASAEKQSRAADLSFSATAIRCELQDDDGRDCTVVDGSGPTEYRGATFKIRFDINLVIGWLRTVVRSDANATITMEMHDPLKKPLVFRRNDQSLYLVMPMSTSE
jgi:DNA polymerase III sliding clamp (beta) subunit (PCNA family)